MTQTRIYLPMTPDDVRRLAAEREVGPSPLRAYAVTQRLERSHAPDLLEEELEYAALTEAVERAAGLQGNRVTKRVVAAADVDPAWVRGSDDDGLAAVEVTHAVPLRLVVSFHVDETAGDQGLEDLLWYDATELDEVLRLL
jgi:hypothetical protein